MTIMCTQVLPRHPPTHLMDVALEPHQIQIVQPSAAAYLLQEPGVLKFI